MAPTTIDFVALSIVSMIIIVFLCIWLGKILKDQKIHAQKAHKKGVLPLKGADYDVDSVVMPVGAITKEPILIGTNREAILCDMYNGDYTLKQPLIFGKGREVKGEIVSYPPPSKKEDNGIGIVVNTVLVQKKEVMDNKLKELQEKFGQLTEEELHNIELLIKRHKNG